jgi:N6-L-threonylcarbamoyladenine synthase
VRLPRALPGKTFDFSFSGLKTAAGEYVRAQGGSLVGDALRDFCASLQEAIADALTKKAVAAAVSTGAPGIVLAGGVAANTRVRELLAERAAKKGLWSFAPAKTLCTDNAAMVAAAGWMRLSAGEQSPWNTSVLSRWSLGALASPDPRIRAALARP